MLKTNSIYREAAYAPRQVWLAGLGAAVITRDWVQNEANPVFKSLVKHGTTVESRAIRLMGDRIETSMTRANTLWHKTRSTVEHAVRVYADRAVTLAQQALPKSLPAIELPFMKAPVKAVRAKRSTKVVHARKASVVARKTKRGAKAATKR